MRLKPFHVLYNTIISVYGQRHSIHASGVTLSLGELQAGHSNQCVKLKYNNNCMDRTLKDAV